MTEISHYNVRELEGAFIFAQAVRAGNTLYLSGHLSWDQEGVVLAPGDMGAQVDNVYRELGETLAAHGLSYASVVMETVYTTDMAALLAVTDRRAAHLGQIKGPAATWVEVKRLVPDGALIEVDLIAVAD